MIQLSSPAPAGITAYSLFTGNETDGMGSDIELAGAGESGVGVIDGSYPAGTMRQGETQYAATCADTTIAVDGCSTDNVLLAEFANSSQVEIAPGDSGGGSFYHGQLIGVHSFDNCTSSNCPIVSDQSNSDNFAVWRYLPMWAARTQRGSSRWKRVFPSRRRRRCWRLAWQPACRCGGGARFKRFGQL